MPTYRYTLEPYKGPSSRFTCPSCGGKRSFSRYVDSENDSYLGAQVGRCNREIHCGYHYAPGQYFADSGQFPQGGWMEDRAFLSRPSTRSRKPLRSERDTASSESRIPLRIFQQSLRRGVVNHFVDYLNTVVGPGAAASACERYFIGGSKKWSGATVFWQLDQRSQVRAGKIMLYDPQSGKRVKEPYPHITWVHSVLAIPGYQLQQCLFGEHLLEPTPNGPVAIVESEKTAVVASIYLPEFLWLATGSLTNLSKERCRVLKDRQVVLFPDAGAYDKWAMIAKSLTAFCRLTVSDLLEKSTSIEEKSMGLDLADYLLRTPPPV